MKVETKRTVPASPAREVTDSKIVCDRCGKPCDGDTATEEYRVEEVEIVRSSGTHYPGDRSVWRDVVDCCTGCYDDVVLPALVGLGFKPRTEGGG